MVPGVSRRPPATPDDLLLRLHAATEVDALWDAVLPLLQATFAPCVRVTLFLGHFEMREARLVFTDPPIERAAEWYKERGRINPFSAYIASHRRVPHYRFSDVVGPKAEFARTEFYRRFARPEGWDKGLSCLFWRAAEVKAMFSLYRAPEQPEFAAADLERLRVLRPHIETAIDRVQKLQHERLRRKVLEEFNRHIPIGLLLLDWDLLCIGPAAWDHGPLMTWTERWGGEPGTYEAFAAGYGRSMRGDPVAEALAELRLVAATLMRLSAGRRQPGAAAEAEVRLRWWRGDPDAPAWQAA